jgi:glutaredoxin
MARELVMYTRSFGCAYVSLARYVLDERGLAYREVNIDRDEAAKGRLLDWVGFLSVPTLLIAENGTDLPCAEPLPLPPGVSPRGVDRGTIITEPTPDQLRAWLDKAGFLG